MRPTPRDHRFVAYLQGLAGGPRGALADLAAGLGRPSGACVRRLRWLAPWTASVGERERDRMDLVAALFATHPAHAAVGNVGLTTAGIAAARGPTTGLEQRFVALLEADIEDVGHHLRQLVALARAAAVPLDWAQLLADLRCWSDPLRRVQAEWARAFWAHDATRRQTSGAPTPTGAAREEAGDADRAAPAAELRTLLPEP